MFLLSTMLKAQTDSSFFKVTRSTEQDWSGGAVGSGGGRYYKFKIQFAKNTSITFDTVWVKNRACTLNAVDKKEMRVHKGDPGIILADAYYPAEPNIEMEILIAFAPNPFLPKIKCDALIQFHADGKKYFYPVRGIKVLPAIAYP